MEGLEEFTVEGLEEFYCGRFRSVKYVHRFEHFNSYLKLFFYEINVRCFHFSIQFSLYIFQDA